MHRSLTQHFLRRAGVLLLLSTIVSGAPSVAARDTEGITVVVRTPSYWSSTDGVGVSGYASETIPGQPELPIHGTLIPLPPTGDWELTFESTGSRLLPEHIDVPAVPVPALDLGGPMSWTELTDEELPSGLPVVDRPDPVIYNTDAFHPASPVEAGEVVWQGGQRLLPVRVYPFQYNPVTRELRYHPQVRITIKMREAATAVAMASKPAGSAISVSAITPAGNNLRIRTGSAGMYRLTYAELTGKGVPAGTATSSFAMTYLGQPIDIQVQDVDPAGLSDGDLVIFYAEAYSGRYMTDNVYFFSYGGVASTDRMAVRSDTSEVTDPVRNSIIRSVHVESDEQYFSTYPIPATADHFFDSPTLAVSAGTPVSSLAYALTLQDPLTTGDIVFRGLFYGGKAQAADPDQSLQVQLNSNVVDTFTWDGQVGLNAEKVAVGGAAWLSNSTNTLTVMADTTQVPAVSDYYAYVDWVELDYPAQALAKNDQLFIKGLDLEPADTTVRVETSGFDSNEVVVYDIRNPRQPVVITTKTTTSNDTKYDVDFWDAWSETDVAPSYFLTTDDKLSAPVAIEVADAPAWNTPGNEYDYIAIVHRDLWDGDDNVVGIDDLLSHRQAEGLRVAKVDVQHIYDLYSGGRVDPEAIRSFLTYAYWNWNVGGARPHYVLLVGDGHYDFKNATKAPSKNLIPPYLLRVDPSIGETAADNRYACVDGPADYLADMALGRIPAQTLADVTAVVNKLLTYEDPTLTPPGAWQNMVTFVADQADDPSGDFQLMSENARLDWLPDTFDSQHLYWETDYTDRETMISAIQAEFPKSVMVQWFGHAGKFVWGTGSVFSTFRVAPIPAGSPWPLSVDYSCYTGYFINISPWYGEYRSLSEVLLLTPDKGSVAVLGPSGLHVTDTLEILNQGMIKSIFQDQIRPVGDAVEAAKRYFAAQARGAYDLLDTTVLFGDPAMPLRVTPLPEPPDVAIWLSLAPNTVDLTWTHLEADASYQVWRGTSPYFDPETEGSQVATVDGGLHATGATVMFTDEGKDVEPSLNVMGDVTTNYFWVVRGQNLRGVSGNSNRVGEFDFALAPGGE